MVSVRIDIEDQIVDANNPLIATRLDGPPGRFTFQDDQIRDLPEGTYRLYLECNAGHGPIDQTLTLVFGSAEHLLANCKSTPPTVR